MAAVLAAQLRRREDLQAVDALAYFGEEGRIGREQGEWMLGVVGLVAGDEKEVDAVLGQQCVVGE